MKKILIACPTSSHKDYCLIEWAEKVMKIAYNYDATGKNVGVLIVDNSKDIDHWRYIYAVKIH
jgi:hypothetical protein